MKEGGLIAQVGRLFVAPGFLLIPFSASLGVLESPGRLTCSTSPTLRKANADRVLALQKIWQTRQSQDKRPQESPSLEFHHGKQSRRPHPQERIHQKGLLTLTPNHNSLST
jgi:hypothetical protein